MLKFIAILSAFFVTPAFAQMVQMSEVQQPLPHLPPKSNWMKTPAPQSDEPLAASTTVDRLAQEFDRQFREALKAQDPKACSDKGAVAYAQQLLISHKYAECSAYADSCARDPKLTNPQILEIGGECESSRFRPVAAKSLYDAAIADRFSKSPDYKVTVFKAAVDAFNGIYETETDAILLKAFAPNEIAIWKAVIANDELPPYTRADVREFLDRQLTQSTGRMLALVKILKIRKSLESYKHADALNELSLFVGDLESPFQAYDLAYKAVYRGLDQDFAQARKIYDVFDRYAGPTWTFPTEENTYNYTQLYGSVCSKQLLAASEREEFDRVREKIRTGELGPAESLTRFEALVKMYPAKADVLTTYGALLALNGRHDEAMRAYWQAHQSCRYYNRANWGLTLEKRFLRYRSYPEYAANEKKVNDDLAQRKVPAEIKTYIRNWNAFDRETQKRIEYGSRIWLPYMAALQANQFTTYIKFSFDLLSESPDLESIRDVRIGGASYPNDNRLWDDVRGLGGSTVVADAAEVFQTVQGDYNLLGHEMAHQFQYLMEKVYQPGLDCIVRLYAEAKSRGRFPDAYSAQNKEEHFAQGVTYSMIPADAPKRYGLNRSWLPLNDPNQLKFIESIERADGDLNKISCSN